MQTYCFTLPPKPAAYLIATVDIILGCAALLLSLVALSDVEKVFGPPADSVEFEDALTFDLYNQGTLQARLDRFGQLHGQMILLLIISALFLILAIGLFVGVHKDWVWPIKSWLIFGCTLTLLALISICVLTIIKEELLWLLLFLIVLVRIYEMWIVFDYLRNSRFSMFLLSSRGSSSERLHNV